MSKLVSVTTKTRFLKSGTVYTARFVRRYGRICKTIHAQFDPKSGWLQRGASQLILSDNVPDLEAWIRSITRGLYP